MHRLQELLVRSRDIGLRYTRGRPEPRARHGLSRRRRCSRSRCASPPVRSPAPRAAARISARISRAATMRPGCKRTLATWRRSGRHAADASTYEPLDVMSMELPPGWRGYGNKDYVDHPDTPPRAAEVAQLRERLAGADRHAVQAALMPYEHLLPGTLPRPQRAHRRETAMSRHRSTHRRDAPAQAALPRAAPRSARPGERAAPRDASSSRKRRA